MCVVHHRVTAGSIQGGICICTASYIVQGKTKTFTKSKVNNHDDCQMAQANAEVKIMPINKLNFLTIEDCPSLGSLKLGDPL